MAQKRMRLPNGFGQITKLNRNLRKPYRVMVTVGKTEEGRPIAKLLKPQAYFKTYNEAYSALLEYNKDPYSLEKRTTFKELFERWIEEYSKKVTRSRLDRNRTLYKYCTPIYDTPVAELRARHLKALIENAEAEIYGKPVKATPNTKAGLKIFLNLMLDYAVEYELVSKNYARDFSLDPDTYKKARGIDNAHMAFTDDEIRIPWANVGKSYGVDLILISCYSGWRPGELVELKTTNISLIDWTFKGGLKTEAGTDRIVPIHPCIRDLVKKYYAIALSQGFENLFNHVKKYNENLYEPGMTYKVYKTLFYNTLEALDLNMDHSPHDCRKYFVTAAKKYNVDEYAIKRIVGHTISDLTERVYTERSIDWLHAEVKKIKVV